MVETMHISITDGKQKLFYKSQELQSPYCKLYIGLSEGTSTSYGLM